MSSEPMEISLIDYGFVRSSRWFIEAQANEFVCPFFRRTVKITLVSYREAEKRDAAAKIDMNDIFIPIQRPGPAKGSVVQCNDCSTSVKDRFFAAGRKGLQLLGV